MLRTIWLRCVALSACLLFPLAQQAASQEDNSASETSAIEWVERLKGSEAEAVEQALLAMPLEESLPALGDCLLVGANEHGWAALQVVRSMDLQKAKGREIPTFAKQIAAHLSIEASSEPSRIRCALALGTLGKHAKKVLPDMNQVLADTRNVSLRQSLSIGFAQLGELGIKQLKKNLKEDKGIFLNTWTMITLSCIGKPAKSIAGSVAKLYSKDESFRVHINAELAWHALGQMQVQSKHQRSRDDYVKETRNRYWRGSGSFNWGAPLPKGMDLAMRILSSLSGVSPDDVPRPQYFPNTGSHFTASHAIQHMLVHLAKIHEEAYQGYLEQPRITFEQFRELTSPPNKLASFLAPIFKE